MPGACQCCAMVFHLCQRSGPELSSSQALALLYRTLGAGRPALSEACGLDACENEAVPGMNLSLTVATS